MEEDKTRLCWRCAGTELDGQPREYLMRNKIRLGDLCSIIETLDRPLCAVFTKALSPMLTQPLLDYAEDEDHTLEVLLYFRDREAALNFCFETIGLDGERKKTPNSIREILYESGDFMLRLAANDFRKSTLFSHVIPARSARIVQDKSSDIILMKLHLQRCVGRHGEICERKRHTLRLLPRSASDLNRQPTSLRVIDVENLQVVSAPSDCSYVALSYIWVRPKERQPPTLTKDSFQAFCEPQGFLMPRLAQAISDDITVCRKLGEQYLWVDALCIIQNDEMNRAAQIMDMDKIYSLAKVILTAAYGNDPS
jgi:hypothetical protein